MPGRNRTGPPIWLCPHCGEEMILKNARGPSATVITIQELSRAIEVRLNGVESALVALEITVASLVKAKSIDEDEAGKVEAAMVSLTAAVTNLVNDEAGK